MSQNTKPQPQRFAVYTMHADGKSFTIKGCTFVFKLDRYGGWRDQHGNYYNSNGEPDFEPEDAELTPSEGSFHSDYEQDEYDEFQPIYDDVDQDEEETYTSTELRNMQKIAKNKQTLSSYPLNKPLRVYFSNMPFKTPPKQVYQAYAKKIKGIINIIFDTQGYRRNGHGHFIIDDLKNAEALVELEGENVLERDVHFEVEKLNQLIMDPIKEADFVPFWNTNKPFAQKTQNATQKKDDIPRFKAAPVPEKKQQPKLASKQQPKKQQSKQQPIKINHQKQPIITQVKQKVEPKQSQTTLVKQQQPQFKLYRLNFEIFETKTRFFNFLTEKGLNKDTDIKNITKVEKDGNTVISMEVKSALLNKINGQQYNGKQVVFTPL